MLSDQVISALAPINSRFIQYSYTFSDAKTLLHATEKYVLMNRASFNLVDVSKRDATLSEIDYDSAIVKIPSVSERLLVGIRGALHAILSEDAFVLIV